MDRPVADSVWGDMKATTKAKKRKYLCLERNGFRLHKEGRWCSPMGLDVLVFTKAEIVLLQRVFPDSEAVVISEPISHSLRIVSLPNDCDYDKVAATVEHYIGWLSRTQLQPYLEGKDTFRGLSFRHKHLQEALQQQYGAVVEITEEWPYDTVRHDKATKREK